jgi:hypothetical protein
MAKHQRKATKIWRYRQKYEGVKKAAGGGEIERLSRRKARRRVAAKIEKATAAQRQRHRWRKNSGKIIAYNSKAAAALPSSASAYLAKASLSATQPA